MALTNNSDLTWRFELRLASRDQWVPITADMAGDDRGLHIGIQEMSEIWKEADEAAPDALTEVLANLVDVGDPLRMTGARIVVWEGLGTEGEPACVLEATADQIAAGRLERANRQVQWALHEVELARAQVRQEIIKAAVENRLSRNTIARLTSGALTRRLVLQLLAGYDLVEGIREELSLWGDQYQRWYPEFLLDVEDHVYLGPFCYGPVDLRLEPSGQVRLGLIDVDGPREPDITAFGDEDDEALEEEARQAYLEARAKRAHQYAERALSILTKTGFTPRRPDSTAASVDDLANTIDGSKLTVSDG